MSSQMVEIEVEVEAQDHRRRRPRPACPAGRPTPGRPARVRPPPPPGSRHGPGPRTGGEVQAGGEQPGLGGGRSRALSSTARPSWWRPGGRRRARPAPPHGRRRVPAQRRPVLLLGLAHPVGGEQRVGQVPPQGSVVGRDPDGLEQGVECISGYHGPALTTRRSPTPAITAAQSASPAAWATATRDQAATAPRIGVERHPDDDQDIQADDQDHHGGDHPHPQRRRPACPAARMTSTPPNTRRPWRRPR